MIHDLKVKKRRIKRKNRYFNRKKSLSSVSLKGMLDIQDKPRFN